MNKANLAIETACKNVADVLDASIVVGLLVDEARSVVSVNTPRRLLIPLMHSLFTSFDTVIDNVIEQLSSAGAKTEKGLVNETREKLESLIAMECARIVNKYCSCVEVQMEASERENAKCSSHVLH